MVNIEIIGALAALTSTVSLFPQIFKVLQTRSAGDLSYVMLWNFLVTSLLWLWYGYLSEASSVFYCNIVMTITAFVLLAMKFAFDAEIDGQ